MAKHARSGAAFGPRAFPSIEACLFHRCTRHEEVKQLNNTEEQTGSECGGCIAELMLTREAQLILALDGYAERLAYSHRLKELLETARNRLNLLQPGAGDFLDPKETDG